MNNPVSFELAKLLKEKGFDIKNNDDSFLNYYFINYYKDGRNKLTKGVVCNNDNDVVLAPAIVEVIMWLYEKYGIWLSVEATDDFTMFCFRVRKKEISRLSFNYNSPIEAYEAAILYTLENLIP